MITVHQDTLHQVLPLHTTQLYDAVRNMQCVLKREHGVRRYCTTTYTSVLTNAQTGDRTLGTGQTAKEPCHVARPTSE